MKTEHLPFRPAESLDEIIKLYREHLSELLLMTTATEIAIDPRREKLRRLIVESAKRLHVIQGKGAMG